MQNTCCMILHVGCYNISKERQNYRATSLTSQLHQKLCQVSEGNHWYWLNNNLYLCTVSPPSAPPSFGPCHFQSIDGVTPQTKTKSKKLLYFEWSPPWHVGWRLSGEGCHWEYDGKNGEFENIDFRFPWLSDTSEMGFGHDVPFLNYSDRLPHPSDLCQPDWVRWG